AALAMLGNRRHAGEPVEAAAARQAQQQGLRLVLAIMGDQQMQHALCRAPLLEEAVAQGAGGRLDVASRGGRVAAQDAMRDAALAEPGSDALGLAGRFGPEAVIDRERDDVASRCCRPAMRQERERQAVGAAGDRHGKAGRPLEGSERRHQGAELRGTERRRRLGINAIAARSHPAWGQEQPSRFFSSFDRSLTVAEAVGNSRSRWTNARHASALRPSWASDMPSFSRLSAALPPFGYFWSP